MATFRLSVFLSITFVTMAGCGTTNDESVQFYTAVKRATKTWSIDVSRFGELIGKEKDPGRLQAEQRELATKIKALIAQSSSVKVPASKEAKEVWDAFQIYLKDQEKIVSDDFAELVSIRSDPAGDMARYRAILGRCQQLENADLARLHHAEGRYAIAKGIPPQ